MYPFVFVAGVTALYFLAATLQRPRPAEILAVGLWAAYTVYEYYVANGTLCDANCNIRVDLVLFLPLLGSATYLALQKEPSTFSIGLLYVICLGLTSWLAAVFGYTAAAGVAGVGAFIAAAYSLRSQLSRNRN